MSEKRKDHFYGTLERSKNVEAELSCKSVGRNVLQFAVLRLAGHVIFRCVSSLITGKNLACEFTGRLQRCVPKGGGPLLLATFPSNKVYTSNCPFLRGLRVQEF